MTIVQLCPGLNIGGVERGVIDVAIYLKQLGCNSIVISNGGGLISELEASQVQHIKYPIHSKNPLLFLLNLLRLRRLFNIIKPDLLLPYSRVPTWLVYFLCKKNKIPFISHCLGIHRMGLLGLKTKYNSVMMKGDRVIANSDFTKLYFLNHYPGHHKNITVIPRSVDTLLFNPNNTQIESILLLKQQWQAKTSKTVVLLPARFAYWKGHEIFLIALNLIKKKTNNFYLVMVGDFQANASYYKRLLKLVHFLELTEDVFFAGSAINMPDAYAAADIVVSASTEPEAFGRTIVEAQAMGKIVVASSHGGALETIESNVTGFLTEPGNSIELANTLMMIQDMDPLKKIEMAKQVIKNTTNLTKNRMCEDLAKIYSELIVSRCSQSGAFKW